MNISFFKLNKNKQFQYIPRYYNEEKEQFDERVKRIEQELGVKVEGSYVPNIKGRMKSPNSQRIHGKKKANIRIFIIFLVLVILAYLLFLK